MFHLENKKSSRNKTLVFPKWNIFSPERKPTTFFLRNCWKSGPTFGKKMVTFSLFLVKKKDDVVSRIWMFHFWKFFSVYQCVFSKKWPIWLHFSNFGQKLGKPTIGKKKMFYFGKIRFSEVHKFFLSETFVSQRYIDHFFCSKLMK